MYFNAQIWPFKRFDFVFGGWFGYFFTDPNSQRFYTFCSSRHPQFPPLKISVQVKKGCFAKTRFSFCSFQGNKFFKTFPWLPVLWQYFQKLSLSFDNLCKTFLISPKGTFRHSLTSLSSVYQQLLDLSLYSFFNIYYGQKIVFIRYQRS